MFGIKRRYRLGQAALADFQERQETALGEVRRATTGLLGVTGVEIAKRSCPDRMGIGAPLIHVATWCLVIHTTHPHHAGAARAALPDRMQDFPVRVESAESHSNRLGSALSALVGWVRNR